MLFNEALNYEWAHGDMCFPQAEMQFKAEPEDSKAKLKKQIQALCACVGVHTPAAHVRVLGASLSVRGFPVLRCEHLATRSESFWKFYFCLVSCELLCPALSEFWGSQLRFS